MNFFSKQNRVIYKTAIRRIIVLFATVWFVGIMPVSIVHAMTTQQKLEQAEKEKEATEGKLDNAQENIGGLKNTQNSLKGQLQNLNEQLEQVGDNLTKLGEQIELKEADIEATRQALDEAKAVEEEQYNLMKTRIKFLYEEGTPSYFEQMLEASSFSELLNRADYISELQAYDQKLLSSYRETKEQIAATEQQLQNELTELGELKVQVEAEQSRVNGLVSQTSNSISAYANQIDVAEAEAAAYEKQLEEQNANIEALKKQIEEEKRLAALAASSAKRNISEVVFADGDRYLLANLIYCEAGGEPYEGQVAVGAVVINRMLSSVYPDTITGVIYQRKQFSPVASGRLALALANNKATPSCYRAADEAMSGVTNVGNCVYFRTPIEGLTGIRIGGHIFY